MNRKNIFHHSVAVGYYPELIWQCECGRTECYIIKLSPYLDGLDYPDYVIRDWEIERDWLCGEVQPLPSCLNPYCSNYIEKHNGKEREYPTATIARQVKAGFFTRPVKENDIGYSEN